MYNPTKDTGVLVSTYDACGRVCQPTCCWFGKNTADNQTDILHRNKDN